MAAETPSSRPARHRPRTATVFVAAFVAGAAAAVGVNRALDVHLAQAKPQVECEPIFVALRALPQGSPLTVWDVALRDLPKAMVPATALRVTDSFEGRILKFPLREGQPLVSGQLVQPEQAAPAEAPAAEPAAREELIEEAFVAPVPAKPPVAAGASEQVTAPRDVAARRPVFNDDESEDAEVGPLVAVADDTAVEPTPAAEPEPAVTVAEPAPVAIVEPTPAAMPADADRPQADRQAAVASPAKLPIPSGEDRLTADNTLDMPSRPPVDIASMPSVMARDAAAASPAEDTDASPGVRYLVVPERIARQADTSFTTPAAPNTGLVDPDARGAAPLPQGSEAQPESTPAARQPQTQGPKGQNQKPQSPKSQPRQAQTGPSQARQPDQRQPQQGPTRDRQPGQPQTRSRQAAQPQPADQQAADGRQAPGPRAWGGMFPNVSAGLEAMGGWRSGRTNSGQSAPGSTTR
jgi:hypothetical protein